MSDITNVSQEDRIATESRSALDELARQGAQKMLQIALENEVAEYVQRSSGEQDDEGHRAVVRNGNQ